MGVILDKLNKELLRQAGMQDIPRKGQTLTDNAVGVISEAMEYLPGFATFFLPPILTDLRAPGAGEYQRQAAQHAFHPNLLSIGSVVESIRRGVVTDTSAANVREDLRKAGWDDARIDLMYKLAEFFPSPRDLIQWAGRQVFETDLVNELRLTDEFEQINIEQWAKSGVTKEQALNFWIAHWQQCSFAQISEMVHRNIFGDDTVGRHILELWFRANEIPTYWREAISKIMWEIPNRIDARRFWELRVIDAPRLQRIYENLGYRGEDLRDEVLFAKVAVDLPKLFKRYNNGWITLDEVKSELRAIGANETTINEHIQENTDNNAASISFNGTWARYENGWITLNEVREILAGQGLNSQSIEALLQTKLLKTAATANKDLTKAELLKAWHSKVLSDTDIRTLLTRMGYDDNEVSIILAINPAKDAKPPTKSKLELLVERIRQIEGFDYKIITEDIIEQDDKIAALETHLQDMIAQQADTQLIETLRVEIESEKLRLKELRALHSA